jgi:hypothetical protein
MQPDMQTALAAAVRNYAEAARTHERAARAFADAEQQLALAQRDLHELARALEVATGQPLAAVAPDLVSRAVEGSPIAAVTMPIVPPVGPAPSDGLDAATIVLQEMKAQRGMVPG